MFSGGMEKDQWHEMGSVIYASADVIAWREGTIGIPFDSISCCRSIFYEIPREYSGREAGSEVYNFPPFCAFHFVELIGLVEIQCAYCLYQ